MASRRMVDLAKIRKKAKKAATPEPAAEAVTVTPLPESVDGRQETQGVASIPAPALPDPRPARIEAETKPDPALPDPRPPSDEQGTPVHRDPSTPSKLEKFKAQAGKRRVSEASKIEVAPEAQLELLTFVIAGEHYAVDIERIVEIVTPRRLTRVPNAHASVVGIISLRGTIVTIVDVRKKLRHLNGGASADNRIVVIDFRTEIVGFLVDRVLRVVKATEGEIEPHPVVNATELEEAVRGVFRVGDALTILLDLDKLLDHRVLSARTA